MAIPRTLDDLPVTGIGTNAFDGCFITSITIPNSKRMEIYNETYKNQFLIILAALIAAGISARGQYIYTTLDNPAAGSGSQQGTVLFDISGVNVVGAYADINGTIHGFVYSNGTWTTLDAPGASSGSGEGTYAFGMSETNIVGSYSDASDVEQGFLYNGTNWTTLSAPGGKFGTYADSIHQNEICGTYVSSDNTIHGFLYDGGTWTPLNDPNAVPALAKAPAPMRFPARIL